MPDDRPAGRRRALLVATASYGDPGLAALRAPTGDVASLAAVLGDASIGGFEVQELIDQPAEELRKEIETFFGEGRPQDLLLLYVSGHGVLSQSRRFYFATANTSLRLLRSTAIEDSFVNDVMQHSRARSIVLVLDCCHSGAFGKGLAPKSPMTVDVEHRFEGQGRVTLSASTELEYAFEESDPSGINELDPAAPGSLFTRSVVEGLSSGDADLDEDGRISVDDLYDYVCRRVRERSVHQTPGMAGEIRGEIMIARSRRGAQLPPELNRAVESNLAGIREGAVNELAALAAGSGGLAAAAREALEQLGDDDSRRVSAAALGALGRTEPAAPAGPPPPANAPPAKAPPAKAPPAKAPPAEPSRPSKRWLVIGGAGALAAAIVAAVLLLAGGSEPGPPKVAVPYDFSQDGTAEVVLGLEKGSEHASQAVSGVVIVDAMNGGTLLNNTTGGVPGAPGADDGFGYAVASGDFNRDALADLAVGVPGRDGVSVFDAAGEDRPGHWIDSTALDEPPEVGGFGNALVARDFDNDGFADLAVGAPGDDEDRREWDHGSIHILFGGPKGLSTTRATKIPEARPYGESGFGRRLAAGDVDGDRVVDLVEGAPVEADVTEGHLSFCRGGDEGPTSCVDIENGGGSSALAIGNINGDRFADVVQGDSSYHDDKGVIKVWLGDEEGLSGNPRELTQNTDGLIGDASGGDEFGKHVAVGKLNPDGWADIVVAAPSDERGIGSVSVIPGSADGPQSTSDFLQRPRQLRGRFGAALSLLDVDGDHLPEILVAIDGVEKLDDGLVKYASRADEGYNPVPEAATGLTEKARLNADATMYIGR
jgi:hypothetical protein